MQMIASYLPVWASVRAAEGISNEPGTRTTLMSFLFAPERNKPSHALTSSRSVMNELNRETTIANRLPTALSEPSIAGTAASGGASIFSFSGLLRSAIVASAYSFSPDTQSACFS